MINFDHAAKENIKEHKQNWPQTPDHSYRILISESQYLEKQIHY